MPAGPPPAGKRIQALVDSVTKRSKFRCLLLPAGHPLPSQSHPVLPLNAAAAHLQEASPGPPTGRSGLHSMLCTLKHPACPGAPPHSYLEHAGLAVPPAEPPAASTASNSGNAAVSESGVVLINGMAVDVPALQQRLVSCLQALSCMGKLPAGVGAIHSLLCQGARLRLLWPATICRPRQMLHAAQPKMDSAQLSRPGLLVRGTWRVCRPVWQLPCCASLAPMDQLCSWGTTFPSSASFCSHG